MPSVPKEENTTANMADLTTAFETLGLATNPSPPPQYHTLNITYPALDLLPANAAPYIYPPKDLRFRQRPKLCAYHLTPSNLSYFHRIPVNKYLGLNFPSSFNSSPHADGFLELIASLTKAPGDSTLEIVSFDNNGDSGGVEDIQHILRATVSWNDPGQNVSQPKIHACQIPAAQLDTLLARCSPTASTSSVGHHPYLSLISDLIHRSTDRACLHVAKNLQDSNKPAHRGEGARWARDWETCVPRSGAFLLASRLQCQRGDGGWVPLHGLDGENLIAHKDEKIVFLLPCGHSASFALKALSLTEDGKSAEVACPSCRERILGEKELAELNLRLNVQERAVFRYADAEHSDAKIPLAAAGRNQELEIPPGLLYSALRYVLESLRVPASASPPALSLVDVSETRAVLLALALTAGADGEQTMRLAPYALWEALMETGFGTLCEMADRGSGSIPPGFVEFMGKWLTRSVNLLAGDMNGLLGETSEELSELMRTCQMG